MFQQTLEPRQKESKQKSGDVLFEILCQAVGDV